MKISLIAIFFSITAFAIIPAKEAQKQTKISLKRIEKSDIKWHKQCLKNAINEIEKLIKETIKDGSCVADINNEYDFYCNIDRTETVFKPFIDAGYTITKGQRWKKPEDLGYTISWCK